LYEKSGACESVTCVVGFRADELRDYFAKYGPVAEAIVKKDPYTGHSRGFGFVKFKDPSSVDRVWLTNSRCFHFHTFVPALFLQFIFDVFGALFHDFQGI